MNPTELVNAHIGQSISKALCGQSYLDPEVLKINGFATPTMRHLFSNLCHIEGLIYLEVGTFCGATFVSAFNNNPIAAVGIDDFSQPFDQTGVREQLGDNLNRWKSTAGSVAFHDCSAFAIPHSELPGGIDVFYYDGFHSRECQGQALPHFFELMRDRFIFIVDDTNWDDVSNGTKDGFKLLGERVKIEHEWNLTGDKSRSDDPIWHNGLDIYLCSKAE